MKDNVPDVFILLINWNGHEELKRCLNSLSKLNYNSTNIVIIDNGSEQDSIDAIRSWCHSSGFDLDKQGVYYPVSESVIKTLTILENGENLGFTGANGKGIEYALENRADYVLFLNYDTVVTPDFLTKMVEVGEKNPKNGLVSCKILEFNEVAVGDKDVIWSLGGYSLSFLGNPQNTSSGEYDSADFKGIVENDMISGCVMLIKKEVIESIGVQDDRFFFGLDDVEYSLRAARAGWKNSVVLDAYVYHSGSVSTEGRIALRTYYLFRNTFKVRSMYFSLLSNLVFYPGYIIRYMLIGGAGRRILGKPWYLKAMIMGILDFLRHRMGRCPHDF